MNTLEENQMSIPSLWVTGEGRVSATPDLARVSIGVVSQNENLITAQQENATIINKLQASMKAFGIPDEHIQTEDYTIFPEYDFIDGNQQFKGFQVSHFLEITVDHVEQVGNVIDLGIRQGANRVASVNFDLKQRKQFEQQALKQALLDAWEKAETLTRSIGTQLYPIPLKIIETSGGAEGDPRPFSKTLIAGSPSTSIAPGRYEVVATLKILFTYSNYS